MPKPTEPRPKVTLSALRDARRKLETPRHRDFSSLVKESASRQAIHKLLESTLKQAGVDINKVDALRKQTETAMREAKRKAETDAPSPAMLEAVRLYIENWRKSVAQVSTLAPPSDQLFLVDTAWEISATSGVAVASTHVEPTNNSAQFRFDTRQSSGTEEVSFAFVWENPRDVWTVINVGGYFVLNGLCQAMSDGGTLPDDRHCNLSVDAKLYIHQIWNSPPSVLQAEPLHALSLSSETGGFFADPAIVDQAVFRGFDLQYSLFLLPPSATAIFEVACFLWYDNSNGEANFVFRDLGRHVMSPGVLIRIVS